MAPDCYAGVGELRRGLAGREYTVAELVTSVLDRVEALDPVLNAVVAVDRAGALDTARGLDARLRQDPGGALAELPLLGVPVTVKDLVPTRGMATTRGDPALRGHLPAEDAVVVARLRAAGAVVVGKTNTSTDGWSAGCVNPLFGATRNPWDHTLSPGGSSGGAAAAVAAGLGPVAVGTDGAGSVRIPAAFCGVVGFKPSHGVLPYVPPDPLLLSHLGPLTRSVADAAVVVAALSGPDARDPSSRPAPDGPATGGSLRIGWAPGLGAAAPDPRVLAPAEAAVRALADAGHHVVELDRLPPDPYPVLVTLLAAEAAAAGPDAYPGEPARRELAGYGARLTAADVADALAARSRTAARWQRLFETIDLLAVPTVPVLPFPAGEHGPRSGGDAVPDWLAWTPNTYPFNLTGQPAVSVPCGRTEEGLPVGLQLVGGHLRDHVVLAAAADVERVRPWASSYDELRAGPQLIGRVS